MVGRNKVGLTFGFFAAYPNCAQTNLILEIFSRDFCQIVIDIFLTEYMWTADSDRFKS